MLDKNPGLVPQEASALTNIRFKLVFSYVVFYKQLDWIRLFFVRYCQIYILSGSYMKCFNDRGGIWKQNLKMWWLIGSSPDYWDNCTGFESGISHRDTVQYVLVLYTVKFKRRKEQSDIWHWLSEQSTQRSDIDFLSRALRDLILTFRTEH